MAERTFTVVGDRLVGFTDGETVSESQLEGTDIEALVESGHLLPTDGEKVPTEEIIPPPPDAPANRFNETADGEE